VQILKKAHTFNKNMIQLEQLVPELQGLRVRMTQDNAELTADVGKIDSAVKDLKKQLLDDVQTLCSTIEEVQARRDQLAQKLEAVTSVETSSKDQIIKIKKQIVALKSSTFEVMLRLMDIKSRVSLLASFHIFKKKQCTFELKKI